jgi:hypothetical protein
MLRLLTVAALFSGLLPITACTDAGGRPSAAATEREGEELAPYMASLQRYAEKLYLAGSNEHWELAHFYEHEVEEVTEELVEGGFVEDRHDVSALTETLLLPAIARIGAATEARSAEAFGAAYDALLDACNGCHDATEHGFIRFQVPDANAYPSQDFSL